MIIDMNKELIKELQNKIKEYTILAEIGLKAYENNKDVDMLSNAVYWEHEKRVLMQELESYK